MWYFTCTTIIRSMNSQVNLSSQIFITFVVSLLGLLGQMVFFLTKLYIHGFKNCDEWIPENHVFISLILYWYDNYNNKAFCPCCIILWLLFFIHSSHFLNPWIAIRKVIQFWQLNQLAFMDLNFCSFVQGKRFKDSL
jgi:hypothetical protein